MDVAFVLTPIESTADLGWVEIATEPIVVALPSRHPLSRRRRIRREELAGVPLVFFPRHYSPGYYDRILSQVYGSATTPNIVRTEPEDRSLVGVSERTGVGLVLAERAATLRYPGVVFAVSPIPNRLPRSVSASASHLPWRPDVSSTSPKN